MESSRRLPDVDLLRILAMTAVISGHVWAGPPGSGSIARSCVYGWHVPLFFFLSGLLWKPAPSLGPELQKRFKQLIVPYLSWLVLLALLAGPVGQERSPAAKRADLTSLLLGGTHASGVFGAFWFIPAFFFTLLLLHSMRTLPEVIPYTVAILGLILCYLFGDVLRGIPLGLFHALPCSIFVLAGRTYSRSRLARLSDRKGLILGALFLFVPSVLFLSDTIATLDLKYLDLGSPVFSVVASLFACLGLVLMAKWCRPLLASSRYCTTLERAAGVMIAVLLVHKLFLMSFGALGLPHLSVFALTCGASWLAATSIHRTCLSPALVGSPRLI